ncbi:MAG: UDP-glucose/GDP-mannose dehydrogenase family protein [Lautropia sp.]|nr:UDP-glucose/GDP-mannose dehydrogenase family protein [Lautropia sp.]
MKLIVIGAGYVGLVSGGCFAELGHHVTCVDVSEEKISALRNGVLPIYEPGLSGIVRRNVANDRLHFTTSLPDAMRDANVYCIAVGTPPDEDGSADLRHVLAVAQEIGRHMDRHSLIINKSTVPVGTAEKVRGVVQAELDKRGVDIEFDVVSNPEFLKEGVAIEDFMHPDRIIVGAEGKRARQMIGEIYGPFVKEGARLIFMGVRDAEMTKYAANAMLATRISFMNEIAGLCDRLGADVENVRLGIGTDQRIGHRFIHPGPGYGGSCFPKDVRALASMAKAAGFEPHLLNAVETRNREQKNRLFELVMSELGCDLKDKVVAVWGLAFKPGTDDMREAPSIPLVHALVAAGAKVKAFDPVATQTARRVMPVDAEASGQLVFVDEQYEAVEGADALILVTEWPSFRSPHFDILRQKMNSPLVVDGRNQYQPDAMHDLGFRYVGIGRGQQKKPACEAAAEYVR